MALRRVAFKPLCRQCGHRFDRPTARCPMCGLRTGYLEPLGARARQATNETILEAETAAVADFEEDADDVVLAPPLERPAETPLALEMYAERREEKEQPSEPAPIARNVSLGSLMIGTMVVATCLGLGRISIAAGIIAFLVLVPAYVRTLSAIWYYRQHQRQLGRQDVAAIFATSFVLSLMGLAAGGLVFLVTVPLSGLVVHLLPWSDPVTVTTVLGTTAAFVTVFVLVHRVWPVDQE